MNLKTEEVDGQRYVINQAVYEEMNYLKQNELLTIDKTIDKVETQVETHHPSNGRTSNINNNLTTITATPSDQELPEEWKTMPFHNLNKTIKFGHQQIKNIFNKKNLTADQVEESLAAFANDLEKGLTSSQKAPLSFLMGIMLKGNTYTSVDPKFKTDEEIYMQKQMEAKIAKANEMRAMHDQAKEASYDIWVSKLGAEWRERQYWRN